MRSFNKKENCLCELAWGGWWQDCHSCICIQICSHTEWAALSQNAASHLPLYSCCPLKCKNTIWIFINIEQQLASNYYFATSCFYFFSLCFLLRTDKGSGHRSTELQPRICNPVLLLYCCVSNCKMCLTHVNKLSIGTSGLWWKIKQFSKIVYK